MSATFSLSQRLAAEAIGTAFLLAAIVGSGIMAERLAGGNTAIALLGNALPHSLPARWSPHLPVRRCISLPCTEAETPGTSAEIPDIPSEIIVRYTALRLRRQGFRSVSV